MSGDSLGHVGTMEGAAVASTKIFYSKVLVSGHKNSLSALQFKVQWELK